MSCVLCRLVMCFCRFSKGCYVSLKGTIVHVAEDMCMYGELHFFPLVPGVHLVSVSERFNQF